MKKKIVRLRWSSTDGQTEFRAVYEDGTIGLTVVRPNIMTNDRLFLHKKKLIERDWIERKVEFF